MWQVACIVCGFSSQNSANARGHMDVVEYRKVAPQEDGNRLWLQRAQWILRAIISGGVGLKVAYLNGLAYNEAYTNVFKLKAFLFSFGDRDLYLGAYSAIVFGLSGWVEYATSSFFPLITICAVTSLLWFAPTFLRLLLGLVSRSGWGQVNVCSKKWVSNLADWLAANTFAVFVFFYVPLVVLIALAFAPYVGIYAGTKAAEAKLKAYEKGCKAAAATNDFCYVLLDKGEEVARGFPIARGEKSIALWWKGEVRIEETSGRTLRSLTKED